jgi:hypothetical protein
MIARFLHLLSHVPWHNNAALTSRAGMFDRISMHQKPRAPEHLVGRRWRQVHRKWSVCWWGKRFANGVFAARDRTHVRDVLLRRGRSYQRASRSSRYRSGFPLGRGVLRCSGDKSRSFIIYLSGRNS